MDLAAYHRARAIEHQPFRSACYAPFVGLSFDVHGMVSVCAFTRSTPLGRVGERPLRELWEGARIGEMRAAVRRDDLGAWCTRCAEEIAGGNVHGVLAEGFDRFTAEEVPRWPTRLEFALSNRCNLRCVMCSGEFSSAIRARREGLPPLPERYGDAFLDEIRPFLPALEQARFLGGEPFLAEINFRLWELMVAEGSAAECNVTTNGTQWSPRLEGVLERLPFSIGISMDGFRRETVESVRAGVSYDRLMANLDRFLAYRDRRGTSVSLTFCLMVDNWREFPDFLRFAEERGCRVFVNTVRQPPRHSLYHLARGDLAAVVEHLRSIGDEVAASLDLNRPVWLEQLGRLEAHLQASSPSPPSAADGAAARAFDDLVVSLADPRRAEDDLAAEMARASHDGEVGRLRCDAEDGIAEGGRYLGVDAGAFRGRPVTQLMGAITDRLGHRADVVAERVVPGATARVVRFSEPDGRPTTVAILVRRGPAPWATSRLAAVLDQGRRAARNTPVAPPSAPRPTGTLGGPDGPSGGG